MAQTLDHNNSITTVVPVEIPLFEDDLVIIQKLDDEPNDVGGLTAAELKAEFDKGSLTAQTYINETLIPRILADDLTEQARQAAESERVSNEIERVSNENARIQAEAARAAAEKQRQSAISGQVASTAQSASSAAQSATAAAASKAEAEKLVAQAQQAVENAATVEIGTVTEGDAASVTNVGTKRAARLNFVLRKGPTGAAATINGVNALNITAENGINATQSGSTLTLSVAGTFAGQVAANSAGQDPGTSLLRNSRFSADESVVPTVNGETVWHYK